MKTEKISNAELVSLTSGFIVTGISFRDNYDKLPLADASGINRFELRSPAPKLRKPYGWAGMSTSTCLRR